MYAANKVYAVEKTAPLRLVGKEHFKVRTIQREIDFAGIAELRSALLQAKIGVETRVKVNDTVLVGVRVKPDLGVIITGWNIHDKMAEVSRSEIFSAIALVMNAQCMNMGVAA